MSCHRAVQNESKRKALFNGIVPFSSYVPPTPPMLSTLISVVLRRIKMIRGGANISITLRGINEHTHPSKYVGGLQGGERIKFLWCYGYVHPNHNTLQAMEGKGTQIQLIGFQHSGEEKQT